MNKSLRERLQELMDYPWCRKPLRLVIWHSR